MMERAADAWEHNQFKDVVVRVANVEMWASHLYVPSNLSNELSNSYYKVCWHEQ